MQGILEFGEQALPFVRRHLQESNRIAWPIKTLKGLGKEDQVVEVLKSALEFGDITFDQARVDKNYDILCYLLEYQIPDFANELLPFLDNPDERVRYACVELLIEQDNAAIPGYLERFLSDDNPDNIRLRQATIRAFQEKGWAVQNPAAFEGGHVSGNLYVNESGQLEDHQ